MTSRRSPVGRRSQAGIKRVSSPAPGWETVFRVLHDPGMILSPDFRILHANRAAQEAVGLSEQELKGRYCYEVFHGTHAPPPGCPLEKLNASKHAETAEMEVELLRRAYRISCAPILDENGKIQSVIHLAFDISARKQVEQAAQDSSRQVKSILDCAGEGIFGLDLSGNHIFVNPAAARMLGYEAADELIGLHSHSTWHYARPNGEAYPEQDCPIYATLHDGKIDSAEDYFWRKDGSGFPVVFSSRPILENEKIVGAVVSFRDITERKQAEAALRESEERYHTLFDHMMDGIYRSTHEGRFVDVNPAMLKMFGYSSREEMLAVDIKKELYFAPEERGSHILDTGQEEIETYRMRRKDGSEIWVEDHGYYIHNAQGEPIYHAGMLRDITERKKAEDELHTVKESLESANRELQQLLAREQLLARTDDLTGLRNRRQFFELAEREFTAAVRYQRPLSILMFDADDFKQVNDIFGHVEGDNALAQIAQVAAAQVRAVDVLARYGGDEFVLLLPQADAQQALLIAERIRSSVAATIHVGADQSPFTVTLSIGIAELQRSPADEDIERVVQRADEALYAAKAKGRNRIMIFNSE